MTLILPHSWRNLHRRASPEARRDVNLFHLPFRPWNKEKLRNQVQPPAHRGLRRRSRRVAILEILSPGYISADPRDGYGNYELSLLSSNKTRGGEKNTCEIYKSCYKKVNNAPEEGGVSTKGGGRTWKLRHHPTNPRNEGKMGRPNERY